MVLKHSNKKLTIFLLILLAIILIITILGFFSGPTYWDEPKCPEENIDKCCKLDSDCACGVHVSTGDCFVGNKDFVDTMRQCPDFCGGTPGKNLEVRCISSICVQQRR